MCCGGGGGCHLLTGVLEFVHVLRRGGSSLDRCVRVCSCVAEGGVIS